VEPFRADFNSILEQCLLVVQDREGGDCVTQVNLARLDGGFSESYVFQTTMLGSARYSNLPFVLKITEGSDTSDEVLSYNKFVRLQLPHDIRVDLLGSGRTEKFSGALYAFAFGKVSGISSATEEVRKGEFGFLKLVIEKVFLSDDVGWYKDIRTDMGTEEFYRNSREYSPGKDRRRLDQLRRSVDEIFNIAHRNIDEDYYAIEAFRCEHVSLTASGNCQI
jgi:hypothetical protein